MIPSLLYYSSFTAIQKLLKLLICVDVFDDFISESIVRHAAEDNLVKPKYPVSGQTSRHPVFSTAILQKKIALGRDKHPLLEDITALVDALLEREWLSDPDGGVAAEIRARYTKNLCDAFRALDYNRLDHNFRRWDSGRGALESCMVAVSAAIGHVRMLPNIAHSLKDILEADEDPHRFKVIQRLSNVLNVTVATDPAAVMFCGAKRFPNALDAAVAANQTETVDSILKWLVYTVRGPWESTKGTWDEMRYVAKAIMDALIIAVRLGHNNIGKLIVEVFIERDVLAKSINYDQVKSLYEECVKCGNDKFFCIALIWKKDGKIREPSEQSLSAPLCAEDLPYVVRWALPCLLRALIRRGKINVDVITYRYTDPSRPKVETPLWITLSARQYKMVAVLLEEGADINGVAPGQTHSAYWRAFEEGYGNDQWFLIHNGADTKRENRQEGQPEIRTKYGNFHAFEKWEPCGELLRLYPEARQGGAKK